MLSLILLIRRCPDPADSCRLTLVLESPILLQDKAWPSCTNDGPWAVKCLGGGQSTAYKENKLFDLLDFRLPTDFLIVISSNSIYVSLVHILVGIMGRLRSSGFYWSRGLTFVEEGDDWLTTVTWLSISSRQTCSAPIAIRYRRRLPIGFAKLWNRWGEGTKTFLKGLKEYHTIASRDYFPCVSISVSENMSPEDILFSIEIYLDLVIDWWLYLQSHWHRRLSFASS